MTERPNILFILTDDQGPWALGCAGNDEIRTPGLDRIAATGVRFEHFLCASPVCSPSRASFLTGRMPSQHGVHDWIREGNVGDGAARYLEGETACTDVLAAHGYRVGLSGKWHLGHSQLAQHGFSHWYVHQRGGGDYNRPPMVRDGQLVTEDGYVTNLITDDALAFLDAHAGGPEPFYLGVHYTAPHSPWTGHPRDIVDSYDDSPFDSCPQEPIHDWARGHGLTESCLGNREMLKGYFAAVTAMDADVARLLDRLQTLGLRERTQGVVEPGLFSACDLFPTLLEHAGLPEPEDGGGGRSGRSFAGLLGGGAKAGGTEGREAVVVDGSRCAEYGASRMVRTRDWKYVDRGQELPAELYHLEEDPGERANLAGDAGYAARRRELHGLLEDWFRRHGAGGERDGRRWEVTGAGQLRPVGEGGSTAVDSRRRPGVKPAQELPWQRLTPA